MVAVNVSSGVSIEQGINSIRKTLKAKDNLLKKIYYQEIIKLLKTEAVIEKYQEVVLKRFAVIQEDYFSGQVKDDPTAPDPNEAAIRAEVSKQLQSAAKSISKGILTITPLSDEFLGITTNGPTSNKDSTPMRWMYYFLITGFEANLYWLNSTSYTELFAKSPGNLGRFGVGFILSPETGSLLEYKLKKHNIPLHPQSGQPGNPDLFKGVSDEVGLKKLVLRPALIAAQQKLAGKS